MNKWKKKLHSKSGESIAETLIALLVSSLALMMLAGAVTTAVQVIERSNAALDPYYKQNNLLEAESNSVGTLSVQISKEGNSVYDTSVRILDSTHENANLEVPYYINSTFSKHPVVSYGLVSSNSSDSGINSGP